MGTWRGGVEKKVEELSYKTERDGRASLLGTTESGIETTSNTARSLLRVGTYMRVAVITKHFYGQRDFGR